MQKKSELEKIFISPNRKEGIKLLLELGLDEEDQIIGYKYVHIGKMMDNIKAGIEPTEAIEKASGTYGRFDEAVKKIDPRKQ